MTEQTAAPTGDTGAPAPDATGAPQGAWYASYDQDTVGWLENRGLTKLEPEAALGETIKGFRNAEKYIGTPTENILKIPKPDAPNEAWDELYGKLGRPGDPKGYELQVPEGVTPEFSEWAGKKFHELGLTKTQGQKLVQEVNAYAALKQTEQSAQYQNSVAEDTNLLKSEWGAAYDQNLKNARQAANQLGVDVATIDKLEGSMGFAGVMKFFNNLGAKVGEDSFVSGDGNQSFNGVMTPAAAQSRIKALNGDPDFVSKYINGQVEARNEMERLHKMAYIE